MNAQKVVLCCCWVVLFMHMCLSQKDCTGVDCPVLQNCIESVLDTGTCCPTCTQKGCSCEGYQFYDCVQEGFRKGKVPEKKSYFVDFGSTECSCPEGGGKISCHYIECPEISPNCIDILPSPEGCPQCGQIGCTHGNQKFEAGHTFQIDQCQICHCPNDGGKLMCSPIPDCVLHSIDRTKQNATTEQTKFPKDTVTLPSENWVFQRNTLPLYTSDPPSFGTEDNDYTQAEPTSSSVQNLPQLTTFPPAYTESSSILIDERRSGLRDFPQKGEAEKHSENVDLRNKEPTHTTTENEPSTHSATTAHTMTFENHTQQPKSDESSTTRDVGHLYQHSQTPDNHDRNRDLTTSDRQNGQRVSVVPMPTPNVMDSDSEPTVRIREDGELLQKKPQDNYPPQKVERELEVSVLELVEACCETGAKWAINGHCNNMEPPTKDTSSICWRSQQLCCLGSTRERQCLAGIISARGSKQCQVDASDTCGLNSYKECCDCCSLGLTFRSQGQECKAYRHMGLHCSHAFFLCCEGMETWDEGLESSHAVKEKPALNATSPPKKVSESFYPNEAFSIGEERLGENAAEGPVEVEDMDECRIHEGNICHHRCVNTPGSFRCECFPGYVLQEDTSTCARETVDEENILKEDDTQKMEPTVLITPPALLPLNPCEGNGPCDQTCISEGGRPHCSCFSGFSLMADKHSCQDINECTEGSHDCMYGYECVNTEGSFMCNLKSSCPLGFERDAHGNCIDTNECQTARCSSGYDCINTVGSYTCQKRLLCGRGYHVSTDGTRCIDSDECQNGAHRCGDGQLCLNLPGSYRCRCQNGYRYDSFGRTCVDVNECRHYPSRVCAQTCENTPGSYLCSCTTGFRLSSDGNNCEDMNECLSSPCSQECANIYGSYQCYCRKGYFLQEDGHTCEDIDECSQSLSHLCTYKCVNVPGSYKCACPESGYTLSPNGRSCRDVDECTTGAHNCSLADNCYNIQGSFRCLSLNCPPNYRKVSDTRCERISCPNYLECQNSPLRITYYYLSFQSNIVVPAQIFRIGPSPAYSGDNVIVSITKGNEEGYFSTRKLNAYTGALYLHQHVEGPRDFLVNVEMKLWRQGTFTTFHARIYVFITANSL
ncbi:fibulin-2 [Stigmatopora nigra]